MFRIVCLVVGYLFGMVETGYLYGKLKNIDIREHGSGNTGTTNTLRVLGAKAGAVAFFGDILKTTAACLICWGIFSRMGAGYRAVIILYTGLGAALGHDFPFYMHFQGGKGVAALGGMILAYDWKMALILITLFFVIVLLTQYVSLASLTVSGIFCAVCVIRAVKGTLGSPQRIAAEACLIAVIIVVLIYIRHAANIKRLVTHTENKTDLKGLKKHE